MQATPEQLSILMKLQQTDLALLKTRKQFDGLPQREQIRQARDAREQVLKKQEQVGRLRSAAEEQVAKFEREDAALVEKQHQIQRQIDEARGDFRNVESRTKELNGIAKRRAKLEEELMAKAEELEKIEGVAAQVKQALSAVEQQEQAATASFQKEGGALKAALAQLQAVQAELISALPEELCSRYEKTAKRCGGVALAVLNGESCGACRMPIEHGKLVEIKREAPLSTCPHCKRMLVIQ